MKIITQEGGEVVVVEFPEVELTKVAVDGMKGL
jgi:hypothetical protein